MKKNLLVICCGFLSFFILSPNPAFSRVSTLSGSLGMEQEYDSNIFHEDSDEEDQWTTTLTPALTFLSEGAHDTFSIDASSELEWDQRRDERDFEHSLSFSGSREFSQYFRMTLSDSYTYNDNSPRTDFDTGLSITQRFQRAGSYEREEVVRLLFPELSYTESDYLFVLTEIETRFARASAAIRQEVNRFLSNTPGNARRRSWENELSIGAEYEFAKDSMLAFGYSYETNNDRSADITEYDEHTPYVNLSYRFNPQWLVAVNYEFSKSNFDRSNDSRINDTVLSIDYTLNQSDRLSASYDYTTTSYEEDSEDIIDQTATFGWNHDFSAQTHMTASLGGNYLNREFSGDENGLELNVDISRAFNKGSISLGVSGIMDQLKRDGSWEDVRESWSLDGGISYELRQYLSGSLNASFEKRYEWPIIDSKASFDDYEASASLSYSFWRWFDLSCSYTFNKLQSYDSPVSDYDEHRLMLQLSMAKEIFRW